MQVILENMKKQKSSAETKIEHGNEETESNLHLTKCIGLGKLWNRFIHFIQKIFKKK